MLNRSTLASYHKDGFAVVRGLFSVAQLNEIELHLAEYLERTLPHATPREFIFEDNKEKSLRCAFRLHERSGYFDALMRDPRLLSIVRDLFDDGDGLADGAMLITKAPFTDYRFPDHQDNAYQFWSPADAVAVTLALDESSEESGAIICRAGSHTQGILPHRPSGIYGASRGLVRIPAAEEFTEVALSLMPGDISLHHVNTIHRTGPNLTARQRRNLGFAYHSSRAVRDETANAQYERDLKEFLKNS